MPYGWQNAPDGWEIGDPIPPGYEDSEINAANLEASLQWVIDQIGPLVEDAGSGWPTRGSSPYPRPWIGWTDPTALMAEKDWFIAIPEPS